MSQDDQAHGKMSGDDSAMPSLGGGQLMALQLLRQMPLAAVIFDRDFAVREVNPAADAMLAGVTNIAETLDACADVGPEGSWRARLSKALARGEAARFDDVSCTREGRTHHLAMVCVPLSAAGGAAAEYGALLIEDITDKLLMQRDLADAERLAAVGRLAARIAHELNNPLDGIIRYINLALRIGQENQVEQVDRYLHQARAGLQRMVQIVSELLEFSRSSSSAAAETDINKTVEEAVKTLEIQAGEENIAIHRRYEPNMPNVRAGNLYQVFLNIVKNAIDAMSDHAPGAIRELTVTTYCDPDNAVIEFGDTGPGLNREVREKMFEPFFTTKPAERGTGLGLAICKDIIERYHGRIVAENRAEGGSCFRVMIPLTRTSWAGHEENS